MLAGNGRVEVGDTTYTATKGIVVNTGTAPAAPPVDGLADTPYWTNRDAVRLRELPRRSWSSAAERSGASSPR